MRTSLTELETRLVWDEGRIRRRLDLLRIWLDWNNNWQYFSYLPDKPFISSTRNSNVVGGGICHSEGVEGSNHIDQCHPLHSRSVNSIIVLRVALALWNTDFETMFSWNSHQKQTSDGFKHAEYLVKLHYKGFCWHFKVLISLTLNGWPFFVDHPHLVVSVFQPGFFEDFPSIHHWIKKYELTLCTPWVRG